MAATPSTYTSRIAQRLMRGLHSLHPGGRLYEIDTRLRPNGSKGLLVSSLAARPGYGSRDFSKQYISSEIRNMRDRIWKEVVAPQERIDLKAGHGGLIAS